MLTILCYYGRYNNKSRGTYPKVVSYYVYDLELTSSYVDQLCVVFLL